MNEPDKKAWMSNTGLLINSLNYLNPSHDMCLQRGEKPLGGGHGNIVRSKSSRALNYQYGGEGLKAKHCFLANEMGGHLKGGILFRKIVRPQTACPLKKNLISLNKRFLVSGLFSDSST